VGCINGICLAVLLFIHLAPSNTLHSHARERRARGPDEAPDSRVQGFPLLLKRTSPGAADKRDPPHV
jgi:hypothetical protein